ncbi:alanyl-tRNA editing protein [Bacillus massilinigeriensis]|uniref:alanyl-tRNA editing protein n=1 Tax=Bacillus massilionigeriensis TaxID=1805475 RepID=UPI00096B23D2|nr:DHHA1 domain-containing protein [Bacillus massilionigeriensis]
MKKLFYQDPYIKSFSAKMICQQEDESGKPYVVLDKTTFYPTGGGQPYDTGTLNGVEVLQVEEIDGVIRHYVEHPLPSTIEIIVGEINWDRRFDHMQQHAGQHILSAAFEELFNINTIGFHLGIDLVTIDLDIEELNEETAWKAERRANEIVLDNRPIETKWVSANELSQYPLRKRPSVTEDIRLVIIPDFDYNGCGGTHPSSTGQVMAIKILSWERQRKKIRLTFVCGNRVLNELHQKQKAISELSPLLNAPEQQLGNAAKRLIGNVKNLEKALEEANNRLLMYEGKELISSTRLQNERMVIGKVFNNRTIQELQKLARFIISEKENANVFLVALNDKQLQFVCAKGSAAQGNMKEIASEILPLLKGKGGGNEFFAQGGGEANMTGEELLEVLMKN